MELVVAITGASGAALGTRLLEVTSQHDDISCHLIISEWGEELIRTESSYTVEQVASMADNVYSNDDLGAPISSGSFPTDGMVIVPCSMDTMSSIAAGLSSDLVSRAASVTLKEGRKLVLVVRESPLSQIHLRNLHLLSETGAVILPPVLTFHHGPKNIGDLIDYIVGKVLEQFDLEHNLYAGWGSKERDANES